MMNKNLYFLNTQSGQKELFTPLGKKVQMYVCGITPYDYAHMGHARCYVSFDVIARLLLFWGYPLNYMRNITDVDDKIVKKALSEQCDPVALGSVVEALVSQYMSAFQCDMNALNTRTPDIQPSVSKYLQSIIDFIEMLIKKGHAYVSESDVYFDIKSCKEYGSLSGRTVEELVAGARVEPNERKKNPGDFALWKGNVIGALWDSPWGKGRPGWHIECSAMAYECGGETIDIHGGGIDLLFPHHENEKAQSECALDAPFARYWLHNAHVMLQSEKMSKSLGNVFFIRDIIKKFDPMVVRFYLIQHHYRTPLDIDMEHLEGAARAYTRLIKAFNPEGIVPAENVWGDVRIRWQEWAAVEPCADAIITALADDCNVPKALGIIFGNLEVLTSTDTHRENVRLLLQQVLGLTLQPLQRAEEPQELSDIVKELIAQREQARLAKDWARADKLRAELAAHGHTAVDTKLSR